ncbi:hypothetical protein ACFLZP_00905 [Patescibacteria group bacterium]
MTLPGGKEITGGFAGNGVPVGECANCITTYCSCQGNVEGDGCPRTNSCPRTGSG